MHNIIRSSSRLIVFEIQFKRIQLWKYLSYIKYKFFIYIEISFKICYTAKKAIRYDTYANKSLIHEIKLFSNSNEIRKKKYGNILNCNDDLENIFDSIENIFDSIFYWIIYIYSKNCFYNLHNVVIQLITLWKIYLELTELAVF